MIFRREDFVQPAEMLLSAVDAKDLSTMMQSVEMEVTGENLEMRVSNGEYVLCTAVPCDEGGLHATVDARAFLALITNTTSETIELVLSGNTLLVKGNGTYKFPLIFEDEKLLTIPRIDILTSDVKSFTIEGDKLASLLVYNESQFSTKLQLAPVQKYYYIDGSGAITFTFGACVNKFNFDPDVRLIVNQRTAKLFKLFRTKTVKVTTGIDVTDDGISQLKARFEADNIVLDTILTSDVTYLDQVPVDSIRGMAEGEQPYTMTFDCTDVIASLSRLKLFIPKNGLFYVTVKCSSDYITFLVGQNKENVFHQDIQIGPEEYSFVIDGDELENSLVTCDSDVPVELKFGNKQSVVVVHGNVCDIIPEVHDL